LAHLADGAYDGEPVYRAVAERAPAAEVIIPPRATAVPSDTAHSAPPELCLHRRSKPPHSARPWPSSPASALPSPERLS